MTQKILIIDDSLLIHDLLSIRLPPLGCELIHAANAAEGLELARRARPDLVLLDIVLPDNTGFNVCRQLKEFPETRQVPVIFLSGVSDSVNKVTGLDLGAVDYVTKPFDSAELQARVRAALRMKRFQDMLAERAQIDGLTELGNRSFFDARIQDLVESARRYDRTGCLILLDLDRFKQVNDAHGHPLGDRVLQSIGELLRTETRPNDSPSRYGGEEFALLPSETDLEGATCLAAKLQERIAGLRWEQKRRTVMITVSIGIASTAQFGNSNQLTVARLLSCADAALYRAKQLGRNRIQVATSRDVSNTLDGGAGENSREVDSSASADATFQKIGP